ncbi:MULTISPECIES: HrpT family type III secretion system protein [Pseudomonas]|nr:MULTISPECIES: HrpT family type III secretion system protein [Pseudomonas]MDY7582189.1 HrpT family type III secretion system protein [Pseudomonas sp. CCI3.1]MEB0067122.1 HrpT family type III secretion system protein [Pseudomonas sp. CCI3.1]MEB0074475.1 HrpT family type III secretion system protein [Pseudomonas sp. CCI1.4]WVJ00206.1 HrpT family type III secretion system protein [Pseudomonas psychrophila]
MTLQGCATNCQGDSCTRPVSSAGNLVIWWPTHMRNETGPDALRPDHLVVLLEQ